MTQIEKSRVTHRRDLEDSDHIIVRLLQAALAGTVKVATIDGSPVSIIPAVSCANDACH